MFQTMLRGMVVALLWFGGLYPYRRVCDGVCGFGRVNVPLFYEQTREM
jgi:hypothetical protein